MESLFLAALAAAAPLPTPGPADLDLRCYRLMAELAEVDDPRMRPTALVAAQYFLGRIDAAEPSADISAPLPSAEPRAPLLRRCGEAMQAGGRDFRTIGEALAPDTRPEA